MSYLQCLIAQMLYLQWALSHPTPSVKKQPVSVTSCAVVWLQIQGILCPPQTSETNILNYFSCFDMNYSLTRNALKCVKNNRNNKRFFNF